MDSNDVLKRLKEITSKSIIEQELELKNILENSDFKLTQLREQLKIFIKEKKDK